jgi:predicted RNA-binding protein associated with RNAse of E/G family
MASRGTYDALGTERRPGDVAVTKLTEGKWWYPTVYRSADGESRGTYVNVCTPVEVFPEAVRYVDLHVDVVKRPDGTVERVDDDELDAAVEAGEVPEPLAERARQVADAVENAL